MLYYRYTDAQLARDAHTAIDDACLGGTDRHWPDGVTQRHTTLTRDGTDWLIGVTEFTEQVRADRRVVLPEPVEVTFATGEKAGTAEAVMRPVENVDPRRTDVLASRGG